MSGKRVLIVLGSSGLTDFASWRGSLAGRVAEVDMRVVGEGTGQDAPPPPVATQRI